MLTCLMVQSGFESEDVKTVTRTVEIGITNFNGGI
jgi:hypothetical protein